MIETVAAMSLEKIQQRLAPLFSEDGLKLVLLFGSVASGAIHKRSDIDLAFLYDRPVDTIALTNRVIALLHTDRVDMVDLMRASPLLKFSVAKTGLVLYERASGMYAGFCSLAFRMYVDTKKLRDARSLSLRLFLQERGLL